MYKYNINKKFNTIKKEKLIRILKKLLFLRCIYKQTNN